MSLSMRSAKLSSRHADHRLSRIRLKAPFLEFSTAFRVPAATSAFYAGKTLQATRVRDETTGSGICRSLLKVTLVTCAGLVSSAAAEVIELKLAPDSVVEKRLTVAAGKFAELCTTLQRGRTVTWQFRADAPTDFNIHYHVDKRVEYPEQLTKINDAGGRLLVEVDQAYCWMWTNRSPAMVAVEVTLKETSR